MQSKNNSKSRKILIFYAKAGGGHESAAKAIKQAVESRNMGEVKIVDVFSSSSSFTQWMFNQAYMLLVNKLPFLWKILFFLWSIKWFFRVNFWLAKRTSSASKLIASEIKTFCPDVVITTYFSVDNWILQELQSVNLHKKIPVYSVVSDIFTPHSFWFSQSTGTNFCVFSNQAKKLAVQSGVKPKHIREFEPFFNEQFLQTIPFSAQLQLHSNLGFNRQLPTIMFSGGGMGLQQTLPTLRLLARRQFACNIIVIGGRNVELKSSVEHFLSTQKHPFNPCVTGFTDKMVELTSLADLVIAKAGPATIFELLAMQKPMILAQYIWPQEKGNVEFIVQNNYGEFITDPAKIASRIVELFQNSDQLEDLKKSVAAASVRSGMGDLIEYIC